MEVRVVYAALQEEGSWLLGCIFARDLTDAEARTLTRELVDKEVPRV
jgi:hypothetical protein